MEFQSKQTIKSNNNLFSNTSCRAIAWSTARCRCKNSSIVIPVRIKFYNCILRAVPRHSTAFLLVFVRRVQWIIWWAL